MARPPLPVVNVEAHSRASSFFVRKSRIYVHRTRIDIIDPSEAELAAFSKMLTVYDGYSTYPKILWRGMSLRHDGDSNILSIPRFMNFQVICKIVTGQSPSVNETFSNISSLPIKNTTEPRSELQRRALNFLFKDGNEFDYPVKILDLPVGEGKTYLALKAVSIMGMKANIFVHKQSMIENPWIKDILKFTDIKREEIGIIQGSESIEEIIKNKDKYKIFITMHRTFTVSMTGKNNGYESVNRLYNECGIGLNIIDEAHTEICSCFWIAMYSEPKYTLYLTATLGRTNYSEEKIFSKLMPVHYSFTSCNGYDRKKFITYRKRNFKSNPPANWMTLIEQQKGVHIPYYCNYLIENEEAYKLLKTNVLAAVEEARNNYFKMHNKYPVIVILLGKLELIKKMTSSLSEVYESIGQFNGLVPAKDKISELKKEIVLSTHKSMDSATDAKIDYIINCIPVSSDIMVNQILGRIRYNPSEPDNEYGVYDIVDTSFGKVANNASSRSSIIRKEIMLKEN